MSGQTVVQGFGASEEPRTRRIPADLAHPQMASLWELLCK